MFSMSHAKQISIFGFYNFKTTAQKSFSEYIVQSIVYCFSMAWIIVGLGNPGYEYEGTRHNTGRMAVEYFAKTAKLSEWREDAKSKSLVSRGLLGKTLIALILPNTFMNKSGAAVAVAMRASKIKKDALFVVHDDTDLPLGRGKLSYGRNSAGHKGVESVMRALKTKDFWRMRIGVAGPRDMPAEKIVLRAFTPNEKRAVKKIITASIEALITSISEGTQTAMNIYNNT